MNRVIKSSAIAVACLGVAAALAGPALAATRSSDPLTDLVGGKVGGGSVLSSDGQSPLMAVAGPITSLTQSRNPVEGVTRTLDGAGGSVDGAARVLPEGNFSNGLPLGTLARTAGVAPSASAAEKPGAAVSRPGMTGAESAPMSLGLLNGKQMVGLDRDADPLPGMFSSLTGRFDRAVHADTLQPVSDNAVMQVTQRLGYGVDQTSFMTQSLAGNVDAISTHDLLAGPTQAADAALPAAVQTELEPVLGGGQLKQQLSALSPRDGSPLGKVAPLVDGPLAGAPVNPGKGLPSVVDTVVQSSGQTTDAVKNLAPMP